MCPNSAGLFQGGRTFSSDISWPLRTFTNFSVLKNLKKKDYNSNVSYGANFQCSIYKIHLRILIQTLLYTDVEPTRKPTGRALPASSRWPIKLDCTIQSLMFSIFVQKTLSFDVSNLCLHVLANTSSIKLHYEGPIAEQV